MADRAVALTFERVRATTYRSDDGQNFLVQLRAGTSGGHRVDGMGLARPRGATTGDRGTTSWEVLTRCLRRLEGQQLVITDPESASTTVCTIMTEFSKLAAAQARTVAGLERMDSYEPRWRRRLLVATKRTVRACMSATAFWRRSRPFQGTLLGVEGALVDLVSRALERQPLDLFGQRARHLRKAMPQPYGRPDTQESIFEQVLRKVTGCVAFPSPPAATHNGQASTIYGEVSHLKLLGSNGTKGHLLEREALVLGLTTIRYSKGAFVATDNVHPPLLFKWSRTPRSSAVSLALCTHKEATRMRLRRAGVPVPMGRTFAHGDFDSARAFAERIGYPVVVKPATGVRGIGVVANIRDQRELQAAFDQLVSSRLGRDDFIVEQHINGGDYRIVVIGDEVIAAVLREPASVEGDGEHTVAELMVNKNVFRRLNPHLWGRPIKYETAARYQLRRAGLRLTSIPERGQKVILSNTCSLSQGGDSIDVLDELHPTIKKACLEAVKAVPGLWFCGIDFLLEDHTKPLAEQEAGICELNAHAAIGNCEYPLYGMPRQVARTVMLQCAEHFGLHGNGKPADSLALRLTIRNRARATQERYSAWLRRHARSFGLSGWVRRVDAETVEAVLVGDAVPVSVLAAAAVLGPRGVRPNWVSTEHITPPKTDGFEILRRKPKEWADAR